MITHRCACQKSYTSIIMTSITWAGPRCVQEAAAILGSQNRTQGRCGMLTGGKIVVMQVCYMSLGHNTALTTAAARATTIFTYPHCIYTCRCRYTVIISTDTKTLADISHPHISQMDILYIIINKLERSYKS